MMKNVTAIFGAVVLGGVAMASSAYASDDWVLVFEDEFTGASLNTDNWSRIDYVSWSSVSDWRKYQSQDAGLLDMNGDSVTLWGRYGNYITQSNQTAAQETYACAGIYTLNTFSFQYGRVEVRAKFDSVQGCWPAIWLMPKNGGTWPSSGEIDIMEHLNYEGVVHQTLHYNSSAGKATTSGVQPTFASVSDVDKTGWHTYGIEWTEDGISFLVDGTVTATFNKDVSTNWPFDDEDNEFYLIIDQQIGGSWVENLGDTGINTTRLASAGAAFEIDSVKVWSDPKFMHIPEPSAFGLLAGLGALALVASRRRREA